MTTNVPLSLSSILVISAAALASAGCGNKPAAQAADMQMPAPAVTVAAATTKDVPLYLDEIGKNGAYESVMVTPQVAGRITERDFTDGAELKEGQLLFVIDPRPYQAALDSAQAQLAQAKAALDLAQSQLKMYDTLNDSRAVSQLDYETKKNAVEVDQAQIQAAEAAVENAKLNLEYCYIHSPIDGRAGARLVDVGNVVTAISTDLLSIQRLDPIYADFTITEARSGPGSGEHGARNVESDGPAARRMLKMAARVGTLTFLDNSVQNATGTVNLRATVPNRGSPLLARPVRQCPARFSRRQKGAVLIPNQATQISQRGPYVYVVKADSTARDPPRGAGPAPG